MLHAYHHAVFQKQNNTKGCPANFGKLVDAWGIPVEAMTDALLRIGAADPKVFVQPGP